MPVSVDVDGPVTELPAAVDLAAYRIVQESLTNVLRHAGTATAAVRVTVADADLTIEVSDTGRGGVPAANGGPRPGRHARTGDRAGRFPARRPTTRRRLRRDRDPAGAPMIRVLIADDQDLVRIGLRALLSSEDGLTVVGEAADGLAAVALAREHRPDVVLMDVRMPGIDGIEATRRIAADADLSGTRVIVLTTFEIDAYVFDALRQGASGFLTKDTKPAELVRAIHLVGERRGPALPLGDPPGGTRVRRPGPPGS